MKIAKTGCIPYSETFYKFLKTNGIIKEVNKNSVLCVTAWQSAKHDKLITVWLMK